MTKYLVALLALLMSPTWLSAQKRIIDFEAINNWYSVSSVASISNDGKYFIYGIDSGLVNKVLRVQAVNSSWRKDFIGGSVRNAFFTKDSRFLVFGFGGDSIAILKLDDGYLHVISSVQKWEIVGARNREKIAYVTKDLTGRKIFRLLDPHSSREIKFIGVVDFWGNKGGASLILRLDRNMEVVWLNIETGETQSVCADKRVTRMVLDGGGAKLAFLVQQNNIKPELWFYDSRSKRLVARRILIPDFDDSVHIFNLLRFSSNDSVLYVELQKPPHTPHADEVADVCIWGTEDSLFPVFKLCKELPETPVARKYLATVLFETENLTRLEHGDTIVSQVDVGLDWFIRTVGKEEGITGRWNELVSGNTGRSWKLNNISTNIRNFVSISPSGRFIVYYDDSGQHCSYDVLMHTTRVITANVENEWALLPDHKEANRAAPNYCGWLKDGRVYVSDGWDIWLLDPSGSQKPLNVTFGIGRRKGLIFSFVNWRMYSIPEDNPVLVNVFSKHDKSAGFLFAPVGRQFDSTGIFLEPCAYYLPPGTYSRGSGNEFIPLKAADKNEYLVKRMTVNVSPNYFTTSDFVNFKIQSDVFPEKAYNWPKSEILRWHISDRRTVDGILFKPSDFDSTKRYPVIINYYEKESDGLHLFRKPEIMTYDVNIPWFVSRGYLVLLADIHYSTSRPGESAYECINAAADKLSTLPFVDSNKIGLEGHSFGGYETNSIVTRTSRFAAAVSVSGISDLISFYGDFLPGFRFPLQEQIEKGQFRMSGSLWQRRKSYIENSPVLFADKVETPLLLIHNMADGNVPFTQGTSFFMAMRKCRKKAWLLQYDNSGHVVSNGPESKDYVQRVTQFFDFYLKGLSMPTWMISKDEAQFKRFLR